MNNYEPLLPGTQIPIRFVLAEFLNGRSIEQIAATWQVDRGLVEGVIRWCLRLDLSPRKLERAVR